MKKAKSYLYLGIVLVALFWSVGICTKKAEASNPDHIYLGSNYINLSNKNEVLTGEGWNYDKQSNTLYLNNYSLSDYIQANGDLNIVVTGTNNITALEVGGNAIISGDGVLNVDFNDKKMTKTMKKVMGKDDAVFKCDNLLLKDFTISITAKFKKRARSVIYVSNDAKFTDCNISVKTSGKKKKYSMICAFNSNVKNSTISLSGGIEGLYSEGLNLTGSTLKIDTSCPNGDGISSYAGPVNIKKSTVDVKAPGSAMVLDSSKTTISNSKIRLNNYGKGKIYPLSKQGYNKAGLNFWGSGKCTVKNSTLDIKGDRYGMILRENTMNVVGSKVTISSRRGSGILINKVNKLNLKKESSLNILGKTYGIEIAKKVSGYTYTSKLYGKMSKSVLAVKGKKKAGNYSSKLSGKSKKFKNGTILIQN